MSPRFAEDPGRLLRRPVGAATRPQTTRLIVMVAVVVGLAVLGVAGAVFEILRNSRAEAIESAEQSTRSTALALTGAVSRTVQSIDVLLQSAAGRVAEWDLSHPFTERDQEIRRLLRFMPHIRQMAVIAADGTILADSGDRSMTARLDKKALFAEARAAPIPMVVGSLRFGRFLGAAAPNSSHQYLPFMRLADLGGQAGPVLLIAAVNPLYFKDVFSSVELPSSARLRLWRYDGTLLVGELGDGEGEHADDPLFTTQLKVSEYGTFIDSSRPRDGAMITSYRTTLNWPLVVSVGMSRDEVLADWTDGALPLLWPAGALTLALLAAAAVLTRSLISRARAEAMLLLSERVLETMSNGVAISDATAPDLPLVYVNPAFERTTGYTSDQVLGRNPRFLHGDDRDQSALGDVRAALADGRSVEAVLRNYRADGTPYWNELTISAVRSLSGRLTHFVAIQRDITDQEKHRAQLAEAYGRIERYSAELERFSFILAHHLQEPARHISVYAQLVARALEGNGDDEIRNNLTYLSKAGARLKELLRDVQLYLAMDRLVMTGGVCQAEAVLDKEWEARSRDKGDVDLISGALPKLQVSSRRLADLFGILIDNSLVFRHPDRPLRVKVEAEKVENGFWRFSFTDNGLGIPPEFLDKVFGVFERLHGRDHFPGNGVGLAIARKLVETLGGTIHAESDGVSGTTIVLTLPEATE
ncbi:MAG: PAS domain-containing protein [Magnetospirillum gryphiswaldense]|nr:PAS domain-containing protein [Magnetospirillum gryphiswaldense]